MFLIAIAIFFLYFIFSTSSKDRKQQQNGVESYNARMKIEEIKFKMREKEVHEKVGIGFRDYANSIHRDNTPCAPSGELENDRLVAHNDIFSETKEEVFSSEQPSIKSDVNTAAQKLYLSINALVDSIIDSSLDKKNHEIISMTVNFILNHEDLLTNMEFVKAFEYNQLKPLGNLTSCFLLSNKNQTVSPEHKCLTESFYTSDFLYLSELISRSLDMMGKIKVQMLTYSLITKLLIRTFGLQIEGDYQNIIDFNQRKTIEDIVNLLVDIDADKTFLMSCKLACYFIYKDMLPNKTLFTGERYIAYMLEGVEREHKRKQYLTGYEMGLERYKNNLLNSSSKKTIKESCNFCIADTDSMNGYEFEEYIRMLFSKLGYNAKVTKSSGDQGIDVITEKSNVKIGVQTKCYSTSVSNTAVQEAVAGKSFYNLDQVMVITNNFYTNSAIELAIANDVVLWDRDDLSDKLNQLNALNQI